ncbi:MAG: tetratricopeptide repeat protein [Planctomycetota bacterium]|nr:tetratricopeptide repeat protein [Planctomycetota bacterium]
MRAALILPVCLGLGPALIPGEDRGPASGTERQALRHVDAGRFDLALATLEAFLDSAPSDLGDAVRRRLEKLQARSLFELGDYPGCERTLRRLLSTRAVPAADVLECRAQLAKALSFQELHDEAIRTIEDVVGDPRAAALRPVAVALCLRGRQYARARPHVEAILAMDGGHRFARFARGIVLSRSGRYREAIPELGWGLELPGARRDASFELALVLGKLGRPREALAHLRDILEADPFDEEACYQASRQHVLLGGPAAARMGALLTRTFETLKAVTGPSSREHHLRAAGDAAGASLLRARRFERLGRHEEAIAALESAIRSGRGRLAVHLAVRDNWTRMELHGEARRVLREAAALGVPQGQLQGLAERQRAVERQLERRRTEATGPLGRARWRLARATWKDAAPHLEDLRRLAETRGATSLADRAARLLLAHEPRSASALGYLARRTRDPSLVALRGHYLARLAALQPGEPRWKRELAAVRAAFLGEEPPSPPER